MERFSRSFHIGSVQGAKVVFPTEYHYRMLFKFRVLTENIQICHLKWSLSRKVALSPDLLGKHYLLINVSLNVGSEKVLDLFSL